MRDLLLVAAMWVVFAQGLMRAAPSPAALKTVGWESHGRDDIREWRSTILKGSTFLKIDFSFMDPYTCRLQQRAEKLPNNPYCILLEHSVVNSTRDYNTTTDILSWLQDPRNAPLMSMSGPRRFFQVCLKVKPTLCNKQDPTTPYYIGLMTNFFNGVNAIVTKQKLNVEFIFDNFAPGDMGCGVAEAWRPWVSTWPGLPPFGNGAVPSSLDNNRTNGDDMFQMLNVISLPFVWQNMSAHGFYKFPQTRYPFIAWEPSDETSIEEITQVYLNSGIVHQPGFLIAYNGDPVMFQVYAANVRAAGQHDVIASSLENMDRSYISAYNDNTVVVLSQANLGGQATYSVLQYGSVNGTWDEVFGGSLFIPSNPFQQVYLRHLSGHGPGGMFASFDNAVFAQVQVDLTAKTLQLTNINQLPVHGGVVVTLVGTAFIANVEAVNAGTCSVTLLVHKAGVDMMGNDPHLMYVCVSTAVYPGAGVTNVTITGGPDPNNSSHTIVFVAYSTDDRKVYGNVYRFNETSQMIDSAAPEAILLTIGRAPHASISDSSSVLLVFQDTVCWNSMDKDDDQGNYAGLKVCDLANASLVELGPEPVLGYAMGSLSSWWSVVGKSTNRGARRNGALSSCSDEILLGTYDMGSGPSAAMTSHGVVAVHASLRNSINTECGSPKAHNGKAMIDQLLVSAP